MDKIYERQIDTLKLARDLDSRFDDIFNGLKTDLILTNKVSWKKVFELLDLNFDFMTEKAKEKLKNRKLIVKNNPFRQSTICDFGEDRIKVVYPTFLARDVYRAELVRILGDSIALTREEDPINGGLLGFLYQYLFFKDNYRNYNELFEANNLKEMLITAKRHLIFLDDYYRNREFYTDDEIKENLCVNVRDFSSFDAALFYIENMSSEELKKFVKMLGENAFDVDEIVEKDNIDTYDYPRVRKLFKSKIKQIGG